MHCENHYRVTIHYDSTPSQASYRDASDIESAWGIYNAAHGNPRVIYAEIAHRCACRPECSTWLVLHNYERSGGNK